MNRSTKQKKATNNVNPRLKTGNKETKNENSQQITKEKETKKDNYQLKSKKKETESENSQHMTKKKEKSQLKTKNKQTDPSLQIKITNKEKSFKSNKGKQNTEPVNLISQPSVYSAGHDLCWLNNDDDDPDWDDCKYFQRMVESSAERYRQEEYYAPQHEERTCIWSGGEPFKWLEKTSGISWVGVNGTDATIVVAMRSERKILPFGWTQLPSANFLFVPLCDMGVWADTTTKSTEFRRRLKDLSYPKNVGPFAVVSLAPATAEDHLESTNTNRDRAVKFLDMKIKGRAALNFKEVKQIAVCALKYLLGQEFDTKMIEAKYSGLAEGSRAGIISAVEVQDLLAAINQT